MSRLWLEIKNTKDKCDLSDLLDSIDESNIDQISDLLPELLSHNNWIIRSDAVDLIGEFKLKKYLPNVFQLIGNERNPIVMGYALYALFDIDRNKALPFLKECTKHKVVRIRIVALSLLYVECQKKQYLEQISKILLRNNCNYLHKSVFFQTVSNYLCVNQCPEVVSLLISVLYATDPSLGIAKEIDNYLKEL